MPETAMEMMDIENTAEPEQRSLGLNLVKTVDMNSLIIGKAQIIEYWELGIYSDLAFIHAALEYERKSGGEMFDLDLEHFMFNWRGTPDPDTGRIKKLTKKRLIVSVATLEEKGLIEIRSSQLSLAFE